MALVLKRSSRLAFPGGSPGVDPSHPAAQGVILSAVPAGNSFINLVNGKAGAIGNTPAAFLGTAGPGSKFTTNANVTFPASTVTFPTATLAAIFELDAVTGGATQQILNNVAANGGVHIALSAAAQFGGGPGGSFTAFTPTLVPTFGVPYFFAVSFSSVVSNAVAVNLATGQVYTWALSLGGTIASDGFYALGNRGLNSRQLGGGIHAASYTNTFLTLPQMLAWAQDPWAFWYPQKFDLLFALRQAATGGSFIPAWARNSNLPVLGTGTY